MLFSKVVHAERLVVVFGLDKTGAYSFSTRTITIAREVIKELRPGGDVFYARRITDVSYRDSAAIFRLEIP